MGKLCYAFIQLAIPIHVISNDCDLLNVAWLSHSLSHMYSALKLLK